MIIFKRPTVETCCRFFLLLLSVYLMRCFCPFCSQDRCRSERDRSVTSACLTPAKRLKTGWVTTAWLRRTILSSGGSASRRFLFHRCCFSSGIRLFSIGNRSDFLVYYTHAPALLSLLLGYMTMINDGISDWSFGGGLGYHLRRIERQHVWLGHIPHSDHVALILSFLT